MKKGSASGLPADECDVTIILLTYNGEQYLPQVLEMIQRQKVRPHEIIAIDSGSSDGTLAILRNAPVKLHSIPQNQFGHACTRNLGVRLAATNYIVFLTQDATPADSCWLERLMHPLTSFRKIAAVYGRQVPRPGADLLESHDLHITFPPAGKIKSMPADQSGYRKNLWKLIEFSNVSSAFERDLLLQNPFDERLSIAEDQEWSKRMIEKGYSIVYEPDSIVLHLHNHRLDQKYRRNLQIGAAFSQFLSPTLGRRGFPLTPWLYNVLSDWLFILKTPASLSSKLKWMLRSPVDRAFMHYGMYKGWNSAAKMDHPVPAVVPAR